MLIFSPISQESLKYRGVLNTIGQLVGIDVSEPVLHVRVDNQLGQAKDLAAEVECVPEARLLALFGGERLHRLQVEVVVKMQIIQILPVDQKVEHIVSLAANLKSKSDTHEGDLGYDI